MTTTPLVFVHGFMGGSVQWQDQRSYFETKRPVITPDLPGFGENAHRDGLLTIADFARFVLTELDRLGIETFDLLGHSMGGMVVQEMVRLAPERIQKLILYGTGASGQLADRFETFAESRQRATTDGAKATAKRISATWFKNGERALAYPHCAKIAQCTSLAAMYAGLTAMERWSGVNNLAHITQPTLILWGDLDRTYSWIQTTQLWQTIPNSNLCVIPNCAHAVHLENSTLFNQVLVDFLKRD